MTNEEMGTALILLHGPPGRYWYADRTPDSRWGIAIRRGMVKHERAAIEYRRLVGNFLISVGVQQRGLSARINEIFRWMAREKIIWLGVIRDDPDKIREEEDRGESAA